MQALVDGVVCTGPVGWHEVAAFNQVLCGGDNAELGRIDFPDPYRTHRAHLVAQVGWDCRARVRKRAGMSNSIS